MDSTKESVSSDHAASLGQILSLTLGIAIVIWLLDLTVIYPNFRSPIRHLPTPKNAHFIFGHIGSQLGPDRGGFYERITREVPNAGLIRVKGLFQDQVLLTDPKAFTEILVSKSYEFPKPESSRKFLEYLIGNGLVVAEGPTHKKQRKHILPSFGFRSIKNLYPLFWAKAIQMTSAISQSAFEPCRKRESNLPSGVIDIEYWAPKATLDIIGTAGLGRDFDTLGGSADELARLYERLTTATPEESRHAMLYMLLGELIAKILMPKTARGIRQITQELRKFSELFVREKRGQLAKGIDQPADTLASLMASGVFSDEDLVDQLLTILAAGHETTSSAFTWTIYALASRPELQTRLRDELQQSSFTEVSKNPDRMAATFESLPLLNGVCNETLRVYPTVPVVDRCSISDNIILGERIAAGTRLLIASWAVNKDPKLWGHDATEYKPERWIDHDTGKLNNTGGASTNYAMMTFIHGPRSCVGQGFAKAELRCLIAAFVGAYAFELADPKAPVIPVGNITIKPKGGLRVKLTRVEDL